MEPLDEIREIYFKATAETIEQDLARAIRLLTTIPDEDERSRAAVFMEGLLEMRQEWKRGGTARPSRRAHDRRGRGGKPSGGSSDT